MTGTLISGSSALQFFERTVYADSSGLDLFIEHASARPIALWLQSIGYIFCPSADADYQTLEMGLDKQVAKNASDGNTMFEPFFNKGHFEPIVCLKFHRATYPNVQVITSNGPPLEMVLNFHSSELIQSCIKKMLSEVYSLHDEPHHSQKSIFNLPSGNIH